MQFSEYGTSEVLRVVDPLDWKIMQGFMSQMMPIDLPAGLGYDIAGVVDQVGEGVTAFAVGDEVLGTSLTPAYAQTAVADAAPLVTKPATIPWDVAGTLAGSGGTAWTVLERLRVIQGETLLIHTASGGVGTFTAQLAVARGARVIGTASRDNHERLRSLGVIPVTYGEGLADQVRAITPEGVDAVLDVSGRGEIPLSIELVGGSERVFTLLAFDAAYLLGATRTVREPTDPGEGVARAVCSSTSCSQGSSRSSFGRAAGRRRRIERRRTTRRARPPIGHSGLLDTAHPSRGFRSEDAVEQGEVSNSAPSAIASATSTSTSLSTFRTPGTPRPAASAASARRRTSPESGLQDASALAATWSRSFAGVRADYASTPGVRAIGAAYGPARSAS